MDEEVGEVSLGLVFRMEPRPSKRREMKGRREREVWGGGAFAVLLWINTSWRTVQQALNRHFQDDGVPGDSQLSRFSEDKVVMM